jgi:hypothetical protein
VTLKDLATGEQQRIARGQLVIRVQAKES